MLLLNLNYASGELKTLRDEAKKRGQEVYMVPPESMIAVAEPVFKLRISIEGKVKKAHPDWNKNQVASVISEFQRKGAAAEKDPALTTALAIEVEDLHRLTLNLAEKEKKLGTIESQAQAMAESLKSRGIKLDTLAISAHSDGANLSGESTVSLSATDIDRIQQENPQVFSDPRHVLLLSCYNLTDQARSRWRGRSFSQRFLDRGFWRAGPQPMARYGSSFYPRSAQHRRCPR